MNESDALRQQKKQLRQDVRQRLEHYTVPQLAQIGRQMQRSLCQTGLWQRSESVFCYYGTRFEPDTLPLLCAALADGKRLYLPRCVEGRLGEMELVQLTDLRDLRLHRGLWEPQGQTVLSPRALSLALVPCVAGARSGQRLGHGGGYYDRFLSRFGGLSVLLCPHEFLLDTLPAGPHDLSTDFVLTEKELFESEG